MRPRQSRRPSPSPFSGSTRLSVVVDLVVVSGCDVPGDSAVQQQAQPVVSIAEAVSDAQDLLDQQVHRFGGAVADSAGAEVGQELPRHVVRCGPAASSGTWESIQSRSRRRGARRPGHDRGSGRSRAALGPRPRRPRPDRARRRPRCRPAAAPSAWVLRFSRRGAAPGGSRTADRLRRPRCPQVCCCTRGARHRRRRTRAARRGRHPVPASRWADRPTALRRSRGTGPGRPPRCLRSIRRVDQSASRPTLSGCDRG